MSTKSERFDDEISLADIMHKLWRRRGVMVMVPILTGALGVLAALLIATQSTAPIIHYVNLTGIDKGKYPNGVDFSPRDLQSPEVLSSLADKFGIEQFDNFEEAVSVSYGVPTTRGILQKYEVRLSQKGLKAAEIDAINAELNEELGRATEKTAQIAIDYQSIGVDEGLAAQMALALPTIWAEVFTTKFRVLDNTQLSGMSRVETLLLDTPVAVLEVNDYIIEMIRGLEIIESDARLSGLQTVSGSTAADLLSRVEDFNKLYLSAIMGRNLNNKDEITEFYQNDIFLRLVQINELVEGIDSTIYSIKSVISGEVNEVVPGQSYGADRMQVTGDAISDIVNLVNKSSLSDYMTGLLDEKMRLIQTRSELKLRLSKIKQDIKFPPIFIKNTEKKLNILNKEYIELLVAAREMNRQNNAEPVPRLAAPRRVANSQARHPHHPAEHRRWRVYSGSGGTPDAWQADNKELALRIQTHEN